MELRRSFGETHVRVRCGERYAGQASYVLDTLERIVAHGGKLFGGARVRFGWTMFTLREESNELLVCEPNYREDAIAKTNDDISLSLAILMAQNDMAKWVHADLTPTSFADKVIYWRGAFDQERIYMERSPLADERDSGWYVGDVEQGAANDHPERLAAVWSYEILWRRFSLVSAMMLPVGFLVGWIGDDIDVVLNGEGENLWTEALSARWRVVRESLRDELARHHNPRE